MTVIPITCDNCGAKYKLPPTFKGSQAKCQKCGSVIDVAKQREAVDSGGVTKPAAAAKPAAKARPAVDRSKRRASVGARAAATDKPARGRGRAASTADNDADERPRRGRAEKKKDNTPMILGAVGLVLLLGVGGFFLLGGDDEKQREEQANASSPGQNGADVDAAGASASAGAAGQGESKPAEGTPTTDAPAEGSSDQKLEQLVKMVKEQVAKVGADPSLVSDAEVRAMLQEQFKAQGVDIAQLPDSSIPAIATAVSAAFGDKQAPSNDSPAPDAVPIPDGPKEPWMKQRNPAQTMADVKSAAELYGEVEWPDSIDAAAKAEILGVAEDLDVNGGIRHIRAKRKLVDAGYAGLFGILTRLHGLSYGNADDAAFGFELNKMIEEITGGLNARYSAVQAGEDVHPAKAQWNTKTVKAWMSTFAKWPDEAAFKKAKKERAKNAK